MSRKRRERRAVEAAVDPKTADALLHVIRRNNGGMGRTRLVKLLYLADCEARKYLGRPITSFVYRKEPRGPFDEQGFFAVQNRLLDCGEIFVDFGPTDQSYRYSAQTQRPLDSLTPGERRILNEVFVKHHAEPLGSLLDGTVYKTGPMHDAVDKQPLEMTALDHSGKTELGECSFESLARSDEEFLRGECFPLDRLEEEVASLASKIHRSSDRKKGRSQGDSRVSGSAQRAGTRRSRR